jgi:predicted transcriptional regulator
MEDCPRCQGCGKVNTPTDDAATGARLRKLRESKEVSLRSLASKMKLSPGYLSFLERGIHRWTPDMEKRYLDTLGGNK